MKLTSYLLPIIYSISTVAMLYSCTQPEGFGGNSHINGVVIERFYNKSMSVLQYEETAKDKKVFITFAENTTVGDNTSTSNYGAFKFEYLWPGTYNVFCYTEDTLSQSKSAVSVKVNLEKSTNIDIDTLFINRLLDWNDGYASIKGKIRLINYKSESTPSNPQYKDIGPAQDVDVYLVYDYQDGYTERIRSIGDGSYAFNNLLKGHYKVFFYSEDVIGNATANFVKSFEFDITETRQVVELETITIEKH